MHKQGDLVLWGGFVCKVLRWEKVMGKTVCVLEVQPVDQNNMRQPHVYSQQYANDSDITTLK